MTEQLLLVLKIAVSIATIGSLLELGLQLEFRDALVGLRNLRFVILTILWGFVMGPALAWLIARVLSLDEPYGIGLIVMSMVPCASYISLLVQRAGGDLRYSASLLLLTCFGMVLFIPFVLPALVTGVTATSWDIGKPLLILVLVPLLIGIVFHQVSRSVALKACPVIKNISVIALVICLVTTILLYAKGILLSVGSLALLSHILCHPHCGRLRVRFWDVVGSKIRSERRNVLAQQWAGVRHGTEHPACGWTDAGHVRPGDSRSDVTVVLFGGPVWQAGRSDKIWRGHMNSRHPTQND